VTTVSSTDVPANSGSLGVLVAAAGYLRRSSSRAGLVAIIVVSMAMAAALDFATSAELIGSILFTLPLALCALQPSSKLLWGVTAVACAASISAEFWGFNGVRALSSWDGWLNRGLLIESLLTLAVFVQLSMRGVRGAAVAAAEIRDQKIDLVSQTERLAALAAVATRDLALRKAADEHLVQMEARYRGLLEAAPDAMVVLNQDGEIVLLNLQAEQRFGYRRDELVGQPVTNIIPKGFAERLIADGARTAAEALAQQIGAGIELIGRRADGGEFPIELMLSPLESAEGILVTAAIRDISVRKDAEAHLVQMEARYRGLLEAAPDAMVVVDERGEIVLLNLQAEKQFGYHRNELVGHPVTDIIPEGFAERLVTDSARSAAEALAQQIGMGIELVGHRKDGSEFPIELMLSPLESADGVLVTAAIRDGTARRNAVESLKQRLILEQAAVELTRSNDDLQQFAYVAAHDLQEPLRMVSSYTQLLANRYRGQLDADADTYIDFAVDGAERMQHLIEDLLAYCQVGISGRDLRETPAEEALARALANLKGAIDESGGEVTHDPLPILVADPAQLAQLFQNIIGNAIKYRGAEAPRVHVSAKKNAAGELVFSMRDNGMGIDPRYFEKIFLMFQRLHGRSEFSGTGIGLSLCKKIAERHGGRMWVDSVAGAGSTFFLALPAVPHS